MANFAYRRSDGNKLMSIRFFVPVFLASLQVDDLGEIIDVYAGFVEDREVNFAARGAKLLGIK